jgi:cation diffusion facilitator CzcD-associated flavoprotein CzcO
VARVKSIVQVSDASSADTRSAEPRFVVIGAGMSGLLWGIRLREAGFANFVLYEKGDRSGGTWRDNTYPGLCCDVPSHLYSYSFAPNPDWSRRFSPGGEIQAYFQSVARRFHLDGAIRTHAEVARCEHRDGRWHLTLADGTTDVADFVICATGVLVQPQYPDIPGLDTFSGPCFHSARWDHGVELAARRVGIVGTGSTAVQIVSALVNEVAHLSLFQRTAQWIFPQPNPAYRDDEKARFRADPAVMRHMYESFSRSFAENFSNAVVDRDSARIALVEEICRQNLEQNVRDPELRAKLTPDYRAACKRLIMSEDFYTAIQHPHAELVTERIERIEPAGVRTRDGRLHELDVLVLATGFKPHEFMRPMQIFGRGGRTLADYWEDGARAYRSVSLPGFPNLFMMVGPNSPIGNFSLIQVAEIQCDYILQLIRAVIEGRCREISATDAATDRFNASLRDAMTGTIWVTGCRSWYLDAKGVPATWPWTFDRYLEEMRQPDLADFELHR